MEVLDLEGARVVLLPVIRGLVSERERVRAAAEEVRPRGIAVSISPEELEALRRHTAGAVAPSGPEEEVYVAGLSAFGEVEKPPPCFSEAMLTAAERGLPIHPLDMDEGAFSDAYFRSVSGLDFVLSGIRASRIFRWKVRAETPEAFVLAWDARVNRSRGHRELQRQREAHMAQRIRELSRTGGPLLALVELERARGVAKRLRAQRPMNAALLMSPRSTS